MNVTQSQLKSHKKIFLTPTFYGIPDIYHTLTLKDLYPSGVFISNESLMQLTNTSIMHMQYQNFKNHIKAHVGPNKKYDAIPLENRQQRKYTNSTLAGLL